MMISVAVEDLVCLFWIRLFSIPDPGSELSLARIPDPHQRIIVFKLKKKVFKALENMILVTHPGSGC